MRGNTHPRTMTRPTISGDFLGSTIEERLAMCRKLAAEAGHLAADAANPETQRSYLDLKRHWENLAAELEAVHQSSEVNSP
jgi:hypothetical protein